jgi:PAS domain S-box-containing protein
MQVKASRQAFKVSLIYISAAGAYILLSNELVKELVSDPDQRVNITILKGWIFVLVTGALLGWTLRRLLGGWAREVAQRTEAEAASGAALAKLRASEEQLRLVLDASADGLWDLNLATGIAELSPRYWEIIGYTPGEAVPDMEFYRRLVHPDDWLVVQAAMNAHLAGKTDQSVIEYRMLAKDGTLKWIWGRGKVVARGADGTPLRMAGTVCDITQQKQVQDEIKTILRTTMDGFYLVDLEGRFLDTNDAYCRMSGYHREELLTMAIKDVEVRETEAIIKQRIQQIKEAGHARFETKHRRKDGSIVDIEASCSFLSEEKDRLFVFMRDITARKLTEAALAHSQAQYRRAITAANAIPYQKDYAADSYVFMGEGIKELTGYGPAELCSAVWKAIILETEYLGAMAGLTPAEAVRQSQAGELDHWHADHRLRTRNGEIRWITDSSIPLLDGQGKYLGSIGIIQDITERKRAEAQTRAFAQLSQRLSVSTNPHDAAAVVTATAWELFHWDACFLLLYDADADTVREMINQDTINDQRVTVPNASGVLHPTPILRRVLEQGGQVVLRRDDTDQAGVTHRFGDTSRMSLSLMYVPLRHLGKVTGFLSVQSYRPKAYTPEDMVVLQALADQCAGAIKRIESEAALRVALTKVEHSRRLLAESEQMGKVGSWEVDIETQQVTWTETVYAIHELDPACPPTLEEAIGFYAPACRPIIDQAVRRAMERGEPYDLELQITTAKGGKREVHMIGHADLAHHKIFGFFQDITERKAAQMALLENEARFRAIFNTSAVATAIVEPDSTISLVNDLYCQASGYSRSDVIGQSWKRTVVPEDLERLAEYNRRRLLNPQDAPEQYEFRFLHKSGEVRHAQMAVARIPGSNQVIASMLDITARKQADIALRESEERYRQLFDLESDAIFLLDGKTRRFLDVNQSAQRLYGYSREEFLQMQAEEISTEPQKTRASIGSGQYRVPIRWHRKKDGTVFPAEITANAIEFQGGRVELAAIRDITERQESMNQLQAAAAQLERERNLLRTLIDHIPDSIYVRDTANRFVLANEVQARNLGVAAPADLLGKTDADFYPAEQAARFAADDRGVLAGHALLNDEQCIIRPTGKQCVLLVSKVPLRDAEGKVTALIGIGHDITERKRMDESHARLATAIEQAAETVVITDGKGAILYANPVFEKTSGYTRAEVLGRNPRLLKSGKHDADFYRHMWATLGRGEVWTGHLINQRKDGTLYEEDATISPIRAADGAIINYVAVKRDVTHEVQLEAQVRQSQKMEAIGTLAGGIAHDFNNMLGAMFGYAHLLQEDTKGNALAQESVEEILKAANRAKELVQQILTFSRQRESSRQVIRLDPIIKEAMKFLRASLPANLKLEMQLAPTAPSALADATQIYQVTMNLATNALHAMEGRTGQLTVTLESFQPDEAFLQIQPQLRPVQYARLTIADTGHGMDAKTLERIYEPFFTTKPVGKGTGLGLSVVHGIMKSHEGVITVESQVGQGTTFRLYFPAQTQAETVAGEAAANSHGRGHGQRILLLDDEPALTSVLQKTLRRLDYQVATSNQASDAIRLVRENPAQFDLVITDLTMPEINGLEVARQLHAIRAELPVILVSGYSVSLQADSLREAGISELLQKPVSLSGLAEAVQRVLKKP